MPIAQPRHLLRRKLNLPFAIINNDKVIPRPIHFGKINPHNKTVKPLPPIRKDGAIPDI
jgi:hypothetical protein